MREAETSLKLDVVAPTENMETLVGGLEFNILVNSPSLAIAMKDAKKAMNVTPKEFEKHVGKETRKWTSNIWVQIDGEKVPLEKSKVMKYYNHKANAKNWSKFVSRNKKFHKDEFIRCSKCNKERRFRRRSAKEMKEYHDALNNKNWECSEWHYNKNNTTANQSKAFVELMILEKSRITCDEEEERDNRKMYRGCPAIKHCRGCNYCICNGCLKCRFLNCNCQPCTDFMTEAKP
ncbi:protein ULTRAPETALA 1-like [Senna tora]|uniref:Protein ULTRAPETALA 1-like n=1 Tax=Senna tora TaxID=362788 RepID=A0A834X249_9FABA|nr:protein ULTRAPETALA 1-like [Senna tora]